MRGKIFFASDFHLGDGTLAERLLREQTLIRWLDHIEADAKEIYLVGDLFDFWFEYKTVVPRGYVRVLGKLAQLRDKGIPIFFFTGNHDMWMFDYFTEELGIPISKKPIQKEILGKNFFIGHGDGLGPGDHGYKFIKKVFANPICQWLFARLHPNFGIGLANFWSRRSRNANPTIEPFHGEEKEWLLTFANEKIAAHNSKSTDTTLDYLIFGHRHLPIDYKLKDGKARYINLGEWINFNSYAVFDGTKLSLEFFEKEPYPIASNWL